MRMLPHIAGRVLGTPLLIGRARLEALLAVLGPRIGLEASAATALAGEALSGEAGRARATVVTPSGVAVIPVFGTLVKRAGAIEAASGLTSCGALETAVLDAVTDPAVKAVLLDIDSAGGEVAGVFDLADLIFEARAIKPIWAIADETAFSAAYAIASAAERVFVPRTGGVGSIGVIAVHVDRSAADALAGTHSTPPVPGGPSLRAGGFRRPRPPPPAFRRRRSAGGRLATGTVRPAAGPVPRGRDRRSGAG